MELMSTEKRIRADHGVVSSYPEGFFGYFGWPSIARTKDGTLIVAASGLRNAHVCPFGRSIVCYSSDNGASWTSPQVVNDYPLDDRDTGIVSLASEDLLISWFSTDTRRSDVATKYRDNEDSLFVQRYSDGLRRMSDEAAARWVGSWIRTSPDGGETWRPPVKVDVTAPHGPIVLRSGHILYFGKEFLTDMKGFRSGTGSIGAISSVDNGVTWQKLGTVPIHKGTKENQYHEPHVAELSDGTLLGIIRIEHSKGTKDLEETGIPSFSLMQTMSEDGGRSWSTAEPFGFHGSPPHLLLHSSGALVCVYGYRKEPFGERVMISRDKGKSWAYNYILRDDGPDRDLGYPASVELADGSVFTIYYQKRESADEKCSLLWSRWTLPEARCPGETAVGRLV